MVFAISIEKFRPALTPESLSLVDNDGEAVFPPRAICCSVFGSVIPAESHDFKKVDRELMIDTWCYHQYRFDRLINKEGKRSNKNRLLHFAQIQINNNFHNNARRRDVMVECGIFTEEGKLQADVRGSLQAMKTAWEKIVW